MRGLRGLWFRLFVLWFCAAQVLFLVLGARLFFDLRAAASALRQQEALLEAGSRAAPQGVAELERVKQEAQARLQEASASLPESLKSADVLEQVYLAALAAGVQLGQVGLSGSSAEGTALRKVAVVSVSATVPDTRALLRFVSELEKGPRPAHVRLPSLQVFSVPTAVNLQVEFWSRKGLEVP